jgi:hypothetical protein
MDGEMKIAAKQFEFVKRGGREKIFVQPAPAKTPAGGTARGWWGRVKHATAGTAALCRIVKSAGAGNFERHRKRLHSLTLPYQLRGCATRPAQSTAVTSHERRGGTMSIRSNVIPEAVEHPKWKIPLNAGVLALLLVFLAPAKLTGAPHEERIAQNRTIDRAAIENLQRWVSSGHEAWCKDARMVASDQLRRIAPDFLSEQNELVALPLVVQSASATQEIFTWMPLDGRATYRVTVERFAWLLPIAGKRDAIVWVPTRTEIIAHE